MELTKNDLISRYAQDHNCSKKEAAETVNNVIELLRSSLADGNDVSLFGFGKFSVSKKPESISRNPHTGESILVPAHSVVKYKPAKSLRDAVYEL